MLDLLQTSKELVKDVKVESWLQQTQGLKTLREMSKASSRITALHFRKADFGLLWNILGRIQWETALEAMGPRTAGIFS